MEKRYQIHCHGGWWSKPWAIYAKGNHPASVWQQISPKYLYEKCARNFAKRNGIDLEN